MIRSAEYWIDKLQLLPHPEGGYFKETYRSDESILKENLPEGFSGVRNFSTAIFYLLQNEQCSKLHRIKSDEMWHFYDGSGLKIFVINDNKNLSERKLGLNIDKGELPQVVVEAGKWFGAQVNKSNTYCLAGCTVSPGFDFDDFELGERKNLLKLFPDYQDIIIQLT
jgi:uncharacterized protein